jgi:NTP pyrophosphatase (non-canonical NTP hydrolase)
VSAELTSDQIAMAEFDEEFVHLNAYQDAARSTDQNARDGLEGLSLPLLGLFGEVGTLLSALKKKQRDKESYVRYSDAVMEEFGDVLWYFSNIASRASLNLSVLAQRVFRDASDWDEVQVHHFSCFGDIQSARDSSGTLDSPEFEAAVIALAGRVGLLLNDFSLGRVIATRDVLSGHLVEILRAMIAAADVADVSLEEAARSNLQKVASRWPPRRIFTPLFDDDFEEIERLPRRIEVQMIEKKIEHKTYVIQRCNGINIGSRLTDNKAVEDEYRFHDVFHLAYAAILGWSPVIRALFNLKRKSQPQIDETEDGARAILIEEGVSTLVFNYALRLNYLANIKSLDYPLLKTIREFVDGYEVQKCPLWQWEKAIIDGFSVFRELQIHRSGWVIADLDRRSITFQKMHS